MSALVTSAALLTLLCIGDSITAGLGLSADTLDRAVFCSVAAEDVGARPVNRGCNGSTTNDWIPGSVGPYCVFGGAWASLTSEDLEADVIHIFLGINDTTGFLEGCSNVNARAWCPIRPNEYRGNLEDILESLPGDSLVLLSFPPDPPVSRVGHEPQHARLQAYRELTSLVVDEYENVCLGVDTWSLPDDAYFPQDIHLNEYGHSLMGQRLAERIRALLPAFQDTHHHPGGDGHERKSTRGGEGKRSHSRGARKGHRRFRHLCNPWQLR